MFLVLYLFCNFCVFFSVQDHCAWKQWSVPGNECRQAEGSHARMFGWRTTEMGIPELRSYKGVSEILTKRNLGFFLLLVEFINILLLFQFLSRSFSVLFNDQHFHCPDFIHGHLFQRHTHFIVITVSSRKHRRRKNPGRSKIVEMMCLWNAAWIAFLKMENISME